MLEGRKWRRERGILIQKLKARDIAISETPDRRNFKTLFKDNAIVDMLRFVENTEIC